MPGVMISYQGRYFLIRRNIHDGVSWAWSRWSWSITHHLPSWRGERVDRDMHCTVWIETDELRSIISSQTGHWLRTLGLCWCQGNLPSSKWPFSRGCCTEQIVNTIILLLNPWLDYCNWSLQGIPELLNCRLLVFKLKLITGWTVSASNQLLDNSRFNI